MRFVPEMKGVTPVLSAIAPLNTVKFKEGDSFQAALKALVTAWILLRKGE
jgi:hypothetical protein